MVKIKDGEVKIQDKEIVNNNDGSKENDVSEIEKKQMDIKIGALY